MPIRPLRFGPTGLEVYHDERDHGGQVLLRDVRVGGSGGRADERYLEIDCPVPGCDSVSVHPIGGGCDPERVQQLFARALKRRSPGKTWPEIKAELRTAVEAMDGPGRFRHDDTDLAADD